MTINLFGVNDALEAEGKKTERINRTLKWKLRDREAGDKVLEAANKLQESVEQSEAQTPTPETESL